MKVRQANKEDLHWLLDAVEDLARFVQDSSREVSSENAGLGYRQTFKPWFEESLRSVDSILYVAEVDNKPVGFISGTLTQPFVNPVSAGFIGQIGLCWVKPEYREQGCSRELVNAIESWFRKRGVEFVDIFYLVDNMIAKKVWAGFGYESYRMASRKKL